MPRVVDGFNAKIARFQKVRTDGEAKGRVSQTEMGEALKELAPDARGNVSKTKLKAAEDLFKSDVPMTKGARELLKSFIAQYSPDEAPARPGREHGMGVRLAESVRDVKAMLKTPDFLNSLFDGAFGRAAWNRSASKEVGEVHKLDNGNFEIELKLVHWRHRGVLDERTIEMNPAGVMVNDGGARLPDPRDEKITADGPIGGSRGRIFKVRADDPIPSGDDGIRKVRADDPIADPPSRRAPPDVLKVRADDPIPSDDDGIRKVRADDPVPADDGGWRGGPIGGGRVFKIRADDPI